MTGRPAGARLAALGLLAAVALAAAPARADGVKLLVLEPTLAAAPPWHGALVPDVETAPAPLHAGDLAALHAPVREKLKRLVKLQLVPEPAIREARKLVDAGRLTTDGPPCRLPPALVDVVGRDHGEPLVAEPVVHCDRRGRGCVLTVTLHGRWGVRGLSRLAREYRASVTGRSADPRAWARAARKLEPVTPPGGGMVPRPTGQAPALGAVVRHGNWKAGAEVVTDALKPRLDAVRACEEATPLTGGGTAAFALDVGADGRVGEVTVRAHPRRRDPARPSPGEPVDVLGACVARALAGATLPAEAGRGRRVTGLVHLFGPSRVDASWTAPRVSHPAVEPSLGLGGTAFRGALLACWEPLFAPGNDPLERMVRLEIGPDGAVTDAVVAPRTPGRPDRAGECLQQALRRAAWSCTPDGGSARVQGMLSVQVAPGGR